MKFSLRFLQGQCYKFECLVPRAQVLTLREEWTELLRYKYLKEQLLHYFLEYYMLKSERVKASKPEATPIQFLTL